MGVYGDDFAAADMLGDGCVRVQDGTDHWLDAFVGALASPERLAAMSRTASAILSNHNNPRIQRDLWSDALRIEVSE